MVYIEHLTLHTERESVISITETVQEVLKRSGIQNGILVVEAPHSTVSLMATTDHGYRVLEDLSDETKRIVPSRIDFKHEESPVDAAGHIKSAIFGASLSMIVQNGHLVSENKRGILYLEHDGPRKRKYSVCVMGE